MQTAHAIENTNMGENMAALRENGRDLRIVDSPIPQPEVKLYDPLGQTVRPASHGIMARLNEKIEITKGTLALFAILPAFLTVALQYGGTLIAWARQDENQTTTLRTVAESQQRIENKLMEFDDRLRQQEIQAAKIDGFKAGVAESQGHK